MKSILSDKPVMGWISNNSFENRMDPKFYLEQMKLNIRGNKNIQFTDLYSITYKIVDGPFGSDVKAEDYVESGIPFLRVENVTEQGLDTSNLIFITHEKNEQVKRSEGNKGEIVYTKTGAYFGKAAVLPDTFEKYNIRGDLALIKCKPQIDKYYLVGFFNSDFGTKVSHSLSSGSTRPRITLSNLKKIPVPLPTERVQRFIGDKFLRSEMLNEKAKKLKKEAEKLIADNLKIKDLKNKINALKCNTKWNYMGVENLTDRLDSEHYKKKFSILDDHLLQLNDSNIKVLNLKEIINQGSYGILPNSSDYGKGNLTFIRSTDIKDFMIDLKSCEKVPMDYNVEKARVSSGEILLEIKGAIAGGAIVPDNISEAIVNGSIYKFSVREEFNNYYILAVLQSLIGELQKEKYGANSVISYLSLEVIYNLQIPILDKRVQNQIGEKLKQSVLNQIEAKVLIKEAKEDIESLIDGTIDESKIADAE